MSHRLLRAMLQHEEWLLDLIDAQLDNFALVRRATGERPSDAKLDALAQTIADLRSVRADMAAKPLDANVARWAD